MLKANFAEAVEEKEITHEAVNITNINISDILEVFCENDKEYRILSNHLIFSKIEEARVLQMKENPKTNEKLFYVHFLNYEKRMDRWVSEKQIKKNYGNVDKDLDGTNLIFSHSFFSEKNVLTRKRSSLINNEAYTEKDNIENSMKIKNVEKIILGYFEIDAWYYSPFPQEFTTYKVLYICEYCLKYMRRKSTLVKHMKLCEYTSPPGEKIYHQEIKEGSASTHRNKNRILHSISVYEINGDEHKLYCQNLCLLAKLFLDHKSIYFDVSPFKFYVLTENDNNGCHIVAYFSKEMSLATEFNLACIMVIPPYQRKGYGQFLISMSYYFSKTEKRICTPETPLSDLGKISYKSYWTYTILETLLKFKGNLSIKELSDQTGIKTEDIIFSLNELSLIKYWKGQQVIQTINTKQIEEFLAKKKAGRQNHVKFNMNFMISTNS